MKLLLGIKYIDTFIVLKGIVMPYLAVSQVCFWIVF